MYYAKKVIDVVFVLNDDMTHHPMDLKRSAEKFLEEESRHHVPENLEIKEVSSLSDISNRDWWKACYWGENPHDNIVVDYLVEPEYKEFLRLKAKYE